MYSRFPEPEKDAGPEAPVARHTVHFHALGTSQAQDRLVHSTPRQPHVPHIASVSEDGRYAFIYSTPGSTGSAPTIVDLTSKEWTPRTLVPNFDNYWGVVGNIGTTVVLTTQEGAQRGKVMTLDLDVAEPRFTDLVPEKQAVLSDASLLGGRLIVAYLLDAKTQVERCKLDGTPESVVELPGVGVMDMLRFDRFTDGQFWVSEFGDPAQEGDFCNLLGYSPYHNIRAGKVYPAILVTTADTDDRVVPAHSFKYVATLQADNLGDRPPLLRMDTRSGHGTGKPIMKVIEEIADLWAFAAYWTGLDVKPLT